ncbi:MAG: hypothetical protein Q7T49_02935 [bacterium]|nr:hypothetical protein [bacterium]
MVTKKSSEKRSRKVKPRVSINDPSSFVYPPEWINYDAQRGEQIDPIKAILNGPNALELALSLCDDFDGYSGGSLISRRELIFTLGDKEVRDPDTNEIINYQRQGNIYAIINGCRRLVVDPFYKIVGMAKSFTFNGSVFYEFSGHYNTSERRGNLLFSRGEISVREVNIANLSC